VPSHDFLFTLQLSDEAPFDDMLGEVAACVFGRVGCEEGVSREVAALLHGVLAEGVTEGLHQCEVQFRVRGGDLQIAVIFGGGREWHTTCPIG
jgi:hypothetical protein